MNIDQAERFQELLEEACDHHIEYDGGRIISREFTDDNGGQCPLTCLLGTATELVIESMVRKTNQLLDTTTITSRELLSFISAFDGRDMLEYYKPYVSAILIGKALREKYLP
jgi:hypothetical protein